MDYRLSPDTVVGFGLGAGVGGAAVQLVRREAHRRSLPDVRAVHVPHATCGAVMDR
jgi:hypothetical protein